jgi:hypothetical protein
MMEVMADSALLFLIGEEEDDERVKGRRNSSFYVRHVQAIDDSARLIASCGFQRFITERSWITNPANDRCLAVIPASRDGVAFHV